VLNPNGKKTLGNLIFIVLSKIEPILQLDKTIFEIK